MPTATIPSNIDNPVSTDTLIKAVSTSHANHHQDSNQAILSLSIPNKPQQIVLQMKDYIVRDAIENSNNHFDYVATINSVFNS